MNANPTGLARHLNRVDQHDPIDLILSKLPNAKQNGSGWMSSCPAHDDKTPSLSIGVGDGGKCLIRCHAGCTTEAIVDAIGLTLRDLMAPNGGRHAAQTPKRAPTSYSTASEAQAALQRQHGIPTKTWTYHDAKGEPVGYALRWDGITGKRFLPVSKHGTEWRCAGMPTPRPLYGLPELRGVGRVYVVEGEKCCDAIQSLGLTATTSAHGSKSARQTDWSALAGKDVIVLPDHDEPGVKYAETVATILSKLNPAPTVKIVALPDLGKGEDIVEFIEKHEGDGVDGLRRRIEALVDEAPVWKAPEVAPGGNQNVTEERTAYRPNAVSRQLSTVAAEDVVWLVPNIIPRGKITFWVGDPGVGKSFAALDFAGRLSTGTAWPHRRDEPIKAGNTIILSAEDDAADTLRPRLDAAGADVARIWVVDAVRHTRDGEPMHVDLDSDIRAIEDLIEEVKAELVIIDPISAYLGKRDSHKNADIRGILTPLAHMAMRTRAAILCIHHMNKASSNRALYRSSGSIAFIAAARMGWLIAKNPDDEKQRVVAPLKHNLIEKPDGLAFEIVDGVVHWFDGPVNIDADALLGHVDGDRGNKDEAAEWLTDLLAVGPLGTDEIKTAADAEGYSWRTLNRAKKLVGVVSEREGYGKAG